MRYSTKEAMDLFHRWHESAAIIRAVFADVAVGGMFTGVVTGADTSSDPAVVELALLAHDDAPLPDKLSTITFNFWGSEEIEFIDFDGMAALTLDTDIERFLCCLSIKYEINSMVRLCELWPPEGWQYPAKKKDKT